MVSLGDTAVPFNNSGYINVGINVASLLNAENMVQSYLPTIADAAQLAATVINPVAPSWVNNTNYPFSATAYRANVWMACAPTKYRISCFNPNNYGVKLVLGPFYRFKKGFTIRDGDSLLTESQASVNSGAIMWATTNGPALMAMNYNGLPVSRDFVRDHWNFNKVSPYYHQRLSIKKRFLSVLLPANGRYDFNIRIPGFRRTPTDVVLADWQYRYKYSHCTFAWRVYSPTMFDGPNQTVNTNFGTGPAWGLTQVKPSFAVHAHVVHKLQVSKIEQPFYFYDGNMRVAARGAAPNPAYQGPQIVQNPAADAF